MIRFKISRYLLNKYIFLNIRIKIELELNLWSPYRAYFQGTWVTLYFEVFLLQYAYRWRDQRQQNGRRTCTTIESRINFNMFSHLTVALFNLQTIKHIIHDIITSKMSISNNFDFLFISIRSNSSLHKSCMKIKRLIIELWHFVRCTP